MSFEDRWDGFRDRNLEKPLSPEELKKLKHLGFSPDAIKHFEETGHLLYKKVIHNLNYQELEFCDWI